MKDQPLKEGLLQAENLDEVKNLLRDDPSLDAEKVWEEMARHRSDKSEKLDLDELDAVSGGADRNWQKDGCAATCEDTSWCGSNDWCYCWDVTYDNFWTTCPDGHDHVYDGNRCVRCGHKKDTDDEHNTWR